jgi:predicted unusual protein kinase regulating ubiquinone biosynthesis (AarF/ABC1/UbiB family)
LVERTVGYRDGMVVKPKHLTRYKDLALLLVKHARAGRGSSDDGAGIETDARDASQDADRLARDLEEMGPTFVKLGQVLSTRADLLPPSYLAALSRLQDDVTPFPFEDVERIVADEIGARLSNAFESFDATPVASASLGQVHRATLRDGRPVVVKVQRPGIRRQIVDDMDAIQKMAEFADAHTDAGRRFGFADMVAEFRRALMAELDYVQEASNLVTLGENLANCRAIIVPQPIPDYCTSVVLTMDRVAGRSVGRLSPVGLTDLDGSALASALFSAYLQQILIDGFFHADPHPGNVFVTDDGRLALLDLGMVARVDPDMQDRLIKLLLAVSEGHGKDAAAIAREIGQKLDNYDDERFTSEATELIARNRGRAMAEIQAGALIGELTRISAMNGLRLPPELTMLGKALLNLDEVARKLDPSFDPNVAIQEEAGELMRRKLLRAASPANIMSAAMEAKEFAERLPGRVNKVFDALAEGQLTLNIEGIDEQNIMRGVQKLANRLTAGLVVAALVIGAALLMRIETDAKLFGYPAVAIVLFFIAAAAAFCVLISIVLSDLPQRRRRRP